MGHTIYIHYYLGLTLSNAGSNYMYLINILHVFNFNIKNATN